mmetsp:Transcript_3744/g.9807  ORF Transcript_3744/g.9807 Transcript_3744/m.9807 type:complete len:330 (-) Transcript_3744:14-1003(-)
MTLPERSAAQPGTVADGSFRFAARAVSIPSRHPTTGGGIGVFSDRSIDPGWWWRRWRARLVRHRRHACGGGRVRELRGGKVRHGVRRLEVGWRGVRGFRLLLLLPHLVLQHLQLRVEVRLVEVVRRREVAPQHLVDLVEVLHHLRHVVRQILDVVDVEILFHRALQLLVGPLHGRDRLDVRLGALDAEGGLVDVELLAGHHVPLALVHLLALQDLHRPPLKGLLGGRRPGLLDLVLENPQLLLEARDLLVHLVDPSPQSGGGIAEAGGRGLVFLVSENAVHGAGFWCIRVRVWLLLLLVGRCRRVLSCGCKSGCFCLKVDYVDREVSLG